MAFAPKINDPNEEPKHDPNENPNRKPKQETKSVTPLGGVSRVCDLVNQAFTLID